MIDIFKFEKNEDESGIGISMSNLDYLIYKSRQDNEEGQMVTRKIISLFELIFKIKNGIKCECDENNDTYMSYEDFIEKYIKIKNQLSKEMTEDMSDEEKLQIFIQIDAAFQEIRKCPKCGKERADLIRYETVDDKTKLFVDNVEITNDDFDILRQLV